MELLFNSTRISLGNKEQSIRHGSATSAVHQSRDKSPNRSDINIPLDILPALKDGDSSTGRLRSRRSPTPPEASFTLGGSRFVVLAFTVPFMLSVFVLPSLLYLESKRWAEYAPSIQHAGLIAAG